MKTQLSCDTVIHDFVYVWPNSDSQANIVTHHADSYVSF